MILIVTFSIKKLYNIMHNFDTCILRIWMIKIVFFIKQMFLRDGKQSEVLLTQQELFLAKEDVPVSFILWTPQSNPLTLFSLSYSLLFTDQD